MYHLYHQKTPEEVEAQLAMQESAKAAAKASQSESNSHNGMSVFLSDAMEQMLANKLGVDKEKLDELKKEIEALQSVENPSKEQSERLTLLTEKLEALVHEASERTAEQEARREPDSKLKTYQSIAAMTSLL
jgi:anti-sigma28 factor (negative regulator of flagellin synthesis)